MCTTSPALIIFILYEMVSFQGGPPNSPERHVFGKNKINWKVHFRSCKLEYTAVVGSIFNLQLRRRFRPFFLVLTCYDSAITNYNAHQAGKRIRTEQFRFSSFSVEQNTDIFPYRICTQTS